MEVGCELEPEVLAARLSWFRGLKFGLMVHWGPYSQWGCIESWPLVEEDAWARPDDLQAWTDRGKDFGRFSRDYWKLNETFNPSRFDPAKWAELAHRAGMRYVCFTTKHHDGFCMYDSALTEYRITHPSCPFHGAPNADTTRAVFDAFRQRGMAVSCYFSKSDWHHPDYWDPTRAAHTRNPNYDTLGNPGKWEGFQRFVKGQIRELMTSYGHVDVLWLDGGQVQPPQQDIDMAGIAQMARSLQPGLLIADRTVGGAFEDFLTPEQTIPASAMVGSTWEANLTMGESFSYKPKDNYKSVNELLDALIDVVGKGGNFLLNVGPTPEGTLCAEQEERLVAIGDWMEANGEAFVPEVCAAWPHLGTNIRYMRRGGTAYALVKSTAQGGHLLLDAEVQPAPGSVVELLGTDAPLTWHGEGGTTVVYLPPGDGPRVLRFLLA